MNVGDVDTIYMAKEILRSFFLKQYSVQVPGLGKLIRQWRENERKKEKIFSPFTQEN